MRKKALAATLVAVGVALILVSTVNLFLIHIDRANHNYLVRARGFAPQKVRKTFNLYHAE